MSNCAMIIAELSGKAKAKAMPTRTEGHAKHGQGQSIGIEIISPRGRDDSFRAEKICRYSDESLRSKIKNLVQQMTKVVADLLWGVKKLDDSDNKRGFKFTNAS